jgi:hypothetical protein
MGHVRKWAMAVSCIAAAGALLASGAWACVSGPVVSLSSTNVKAGQEIGVTGTGFNATSPDTVVVRFNALDGPVLGTVPGPLAGGTLDTKVTIPDGTKPGSYILVVSRQNAQGSLSQAPTRVVFSVLGEAGSNPVLGAPVATADTTVRQNGLVRSDDSVSTGTLALVALGVAGVGMFLAGMAALFASRRPRQPEVARA